jgi:hypothetical protein
MKRSKPLRRVNPERAARRREQRASEGPLTKPEWELAVRRLDRGLCVVEGVVVPHASYSYHHIVAKQRLRGDKRFDIVWHPWNGVTLSYGVHNAWETRHEGLRIRDLPSRCLEFAEEYGYMDYIERLYPA